VRPEWRRGLEDAGYQVIVYVHPFTYVVWDPAGGSAPPPAAGFVRWSGPFLPAYRVLPRWRSLPADPVRLDAVLYRGGDVEAAVAGLEALGGRGLDRGVIDRRFEVVTLTLPGDRLAGAARLPAVYSLQPVPTDGGLRGEMSDQVNVNNVDLTNLAFPGYQSWLTSVGLDGAGVTIANVDGGVNQAHADLAARMLPCTGVTCSGGSSTHGTHTAGIMAADGSSGATDSFGFLRGLGVAPGANLVEQVYSPHFQAPNGMLLLMRDSRANGAPLSGNSWGPAGSPRGYDNDTMQVDIGVRDSDPITRGDQPLTFVLSFMNGNGGTSSQGTPDEAKNLFNIGSTKMQDSDGAQILEIDDLSANTAHGPALDGRTIPHLVAPGCRVDSTVTSGYGLLCGTSMASPHVSGAVALFIERYRGLAGADPSPALVKAAFLAVGRDLAGHDDADGNTLGHPFDSKQGWGRMDLGAVVDPPDGVIYVEQDTVLDSTGEQWSATFAVDDPSQPVRVMLVWTDAPGHGLGGSTPAWNNDLDLEVDAGGATYLGNVFGASGWSATGGTADDRNNTEGVKLGPTAPDTEVTIRVIAANVSSDGVPAAGDATDQDFAVVCVNCLTEPPIFVDGFESGDTSAWSAIAP
jgi:subtilisin family serine protease